MKDATNIGNKEPDLRKWTRAFAVGGVGFVKFARGLARDEFSTTLGKKIDWEADGSLCQEANERFSMAISSIKTARPSTPLKEVYFATVRPDSAPPIVPSAFA